MKRVYDLTSLLKARTLDRKPADSTPVAEPANISYLPIPYRAATLNDFFEVSRICEVDKMRVIIGLDRDTQERCGDALIYLLTALYEGFAKHEQSEEYQIRTHYGPENLSNQVLFAVNDFNNQFPMRRGVFQRNVDALDEIKICAKTFARHCALHGFKTEYFTAIGQSEKKLVKWGTIEAYANIILSSRPVIVF